MNAMCKTGTVRMMAAMLIAAAAACSCSMLSGDDGASPDYGPVNEADYVRGRFDPVKHPLFVKLADLGIPCDRPHYLRREAAESLKKMYLAMKKDLPGVKFWVQSSTRNWDTQKAIWERRWAGLAAGKKKMTEPEIAAEILRSSSVPGTSRHHWGSDFDMNILKNAYYEKGDGARLYAWMKSRAHEFGFCQPFSAGRKTGYMEERWHWSYMPLARDFQRQWNAHFGENPGLVIKDGDFRGSPHSVKYAAVNVNSINQSCLEQ
jgi:LAS superfamily LD-carboxypeptidase LdcB